MRVKAAKVPGAPQPPNVLWETPRGKQGTKATLGFRQSCRFREEKSGASQPGRDGSQETSNRLETFLVVTTGRRAATGTEWVAARGVTKHPTVHGTAPYNKGLSAPNVNSAELEKP